MPNLGMYLMFSKTPKNRQCYDEHGTAAYNSDKEESHEKDWIK